MDVCCGDMVGITDLAHEVLQPLTTGSSAIMTVNMPEYGFTVNA